MPRTRKVGPITVHKADGTVEVVKQGEFDKRRFSLRRYRRSDTWRRVRRRRLKHDGYRCVKCKSTVKLEVHHRTYERVPGNELLEDLVTLCQRCHLTEHQWLRRGVSMI